MIENDEDGRHKVYWLGHRTQLLRAQDISADVDGLREAKRDIDGLRSRGVTRFLDLSRSNKHHTDDVEVDEEAMDDADIESHILEPPTTRTNLLSFCFPLPSVEPADAPMEPLPEEELPPNPMSPVAGDQPSIGSPSLADSPMNQNDAVDVEDSIEPSREPSAAASPGPAARDAPELDPATAALYQPAGPEEDFHDRRLRVVWPSS